MNISMSMLNITGYTTLFLFPISAIAIILIFKWASSTTNTNKKVPPSPTKLPIIGNLHQLGSHPHRSLRSLAQRHGHMMLLQLGSVPTLVVSSAQAAREIMKTHDLVFATRPKSSIMARLLYNYKDVASAPYGDYWRKIRSICVLHLLNSKRVQSFRPVREEETALLVKKLEENCSSPTNLSECFGVLTNDVVCRVALGRKYSVGEDAKRFQILLRRFGELLGGFDIGDCISWLNWVNRFNGFDRKIEEVTNEFDCFLEGVVDEHLDRHELEKRSQVSVGVDDQMDFVDVLLWIQNENMINSPIDRTGIKAIILDMFAAGTDTTYTVLEWAMTELIRHPEVMKKLQQEVQEIAKGKHQINEDDLNKLHYLKAVIKETLRLHPPIPLLVFRESRQDVEVMGFNINKGTQVITNAWAIGRDPCSWTKADEFIPERFMNSCIDFKGRDFELIPFGAGRRGCPGILLATAVNELVLANVVLRFEWSLPVDSKELDMAESTGLTMHRKYPLIAIPTPYSSKTSCVQSNY